MNPVCDNCEKQPAEVHILVRVSPASWLCLCATCLPESWHAEDERMWRERAEWLKQQVPPELNGLTREQLWRMLELPE